MPPDVHADSSSPGPSPRRGRAMYPMLLDVSGRRIVVVGGGAVALRKVNGLIDAGAAAKLLRVVAPRHRHAFPVGVVLVEEEYRDEHLADAELVFAATDAAAVNRQVVLDAHRRGLLVCRADVDDDADDDAADGSGATGTSGASTPDVARGDFITPAKLVRGEVIVTVAAAGNPALAATIRDALAARFDDRWARMAAAMQMLRPLIRRNAKLSIESRRAIFRELASPEAMNVIGDRDGDDAMDALRAWLSQRHPEFVVSHPGS